MRGLCVIFVSSFALLGCSENKGNLEAREAYWRARVASELRPGASRATVEAFFSGEGLEHSYVEPTHSVEGIERNVSGNSIVSFSVTFSCKFGSANTLVSCTVSHIGTGP